MDNWDNDWDWSWDEPIQPVEEFSVENYLKRINFNNINSWELINNIKYLSEENKKKVLNNTDVKNKLKYLLIEQGNDEYREYENLFNVIDVEYFFDIYNYTEIANYFKENRMKYIYRLYATMCQKDINSLVKIVLKDDELFKNFVKELSNFYSVFGEVDYENIVLFLKKADELNISIDYYSGLCGIKKEYELKIIEEDFSESMLLSIINNMSQENKNKFFNQNKKALFLYRKLNVDNIIESELPDTIIEDKYFLDTIQHESLLEFRKRINTLAMNNDDYIVEQKFEKWKDDLIHSIDIDLGIFGAYKEILNNIKENPNSGINFDFKQKYLEKYNIRHIIRGNIQYDAEGNIIFEEVIRKMQEITNYKLSELIIDNLFRDDIYNVWLNIKEIIRYDESVTDKILDVNKLNFYKKVLEIDKMDVKTKLDFYNEYKDKKVYEEFYDDLRNSKNDAYSKINNKLINIYEHSNYKSESLSTEYDTMVYDLRDKEYYMLVRYMRFFRDKSYRERKCYTIINNNKTDTFGDNEYGMLYGYNSFDIDNVLHMNESDSFSAPTNDANASSRYPNRIMTPEQITNSYFGYNEIQIINNYIDNGTYDVKKPDFIVCKDKIREKDVHESKRLNIPIVLIKSQKIERDNIIDIGENVGLGRNNYYTQGSYEEDKHLDARKK